MIRDQWAAEPALFLRKHHVFALVVASGLLAIGALQRLGFAFARLIYNYQDWANIDLRNFYRLVHTWFAGEPLVGSVYPPATYAMLWPFLGWGDLDAARWLWAATSMVALCWIAVILRKESRAVSSAEKTVWTLLPFAAYASAATIGNGQLGIHVIAPLLAGVLILRDRQGSWMTDCAAATMILFALIKPPISAPFFWIVVFSFSRLRPSLLVVMGYAGLTGLAAWLRSSAPVLVPVLERSLQRGVEGTVIGSAEAGGGYANIHDLLTYLGLDKWNAAASLVIVALLGWWVFRHRRVDVWILLGVTAVVARFWAYHRLHDDLLLLIPMITVARRLHDPNQVRRSGGAVILAMLSVSMLVPAGVIFAPYPIGLAAQIGQVLVWGVTLVYLILLGRRVSLDENLCCPKG